MRSPFPARRFAQLAGIVLVATLAGAFAVAQAADPEGLWIRAEAAFEAGDAAGAREALQHLADGYPRSPRAPGALARLARLTTDPDSARGLYERIADQFPRAPEAAEALIAIAEADYALGRYDQVLAKLRPATHDRFEPAVRRRALLLLADAGRQAGRLARAEEDLTRLTELEPTPLEDQRAMLGLASIQRSSGNLGEESRLLAECAGRHPDGDLAPVVLWQWARSLEAQGLADAAAERMTELVARFPATPEGAAARDALMPIDRSSSSRLPPVIAEHGGELAIWDEVPLDTTGAASGERDRAGARSREAAASGEDAAAEPGAWMVRTGRFPTWGGADSLRIRVGNAMRDSLGVHPGPDGPAPFALASRVFTRRDVAEAFARKLESVAGFISVVTPVEREEEKR